MKRPDQGPAFEIELSGRLFAAATAIATTTTVAATTATAITTTATPAATVTATITPIPAAKTAGTRGALFARTGDIDRQGAAIHLVAVKSFDALLGLVAVPHRDERETTGPSRELVEDDLNDIDRADLAEQGLEVLRGAGEGKVSHVELVVF